MSFLLETALREAKYTWRHATETPCHITCGVQSAFGILPVAKPTMPFSKKSLTEQNAPNVSSSLQITKATGARLPLPGRSRQSRNALRK